MFGCAGMGHFVLKQEAHAASVSAQKGMNNTYIIGAMKTDVDKSSTSSKYTC